VKQIKTGTNMFKFNTSAIVPTLAVFLLPTLPFAQAQSNGHILSVSQLRDKNILIIAGEPEKDHPNDDLLVKKHLEQQGYVVNMGTEDDDASKAAGEDLILLSSTADPREIASKYAESAIPVFTWNTVDYPDMKMTGPERHVDFETLDPVQDFARAFTMLYGYFPNVTNPIVRELSIPRSQMFGTLYLQPQAFGWAKPAPSADIVVNIEGETTHAAVFTYEKGATMYSGFVAPARRVGFYLQDATFHYLTAVHGEAETDPNLAQWWVSLKLFDASIRWALSPATVPSPYDPGALKNKLAAVAKGKKLLFVRRLNTPEGEESDDHIAEHFKELGFIVTEADQTQPDTMADGQDVVVLSATNSKYKMSNKYRDVKIPLLCLEGLSADILKMANRHRFVDYGEHGEPKESEDPPEAYLEIVGSYHPMAAGLKPGYVKYLKEADVLKWAMPLPSAVIIAILPNSFHERAIFGYEKGAAMADEFIAPARRTMIPVDNPAFDDLTEQGHALFDAAVLWTISEPAH
jgi:hypothetical protein